MKAIKLGKMEPDYGICSPVSEPDKDQKMVERFPCVSIYNREALPKLRVGQKVTLMGVVTEFGDKERKVKEDGKSSVEDFRSAEIDIMELQVDGNESEEKPKDEDEIEKGLKEAEEPDDESDDEE